MRGPISLYNNKERRKRDTEERFLYCITFVDPLLHRGGRWEKARNKKLKQIYKIFKNIINAEISEVF